MKNSEMDNSRGSVTMIPLKDVNDDNDDNIRSPTVLVKGERRVNSDNKKSGDAPTLDLSEDEWSDDSYFDDDHLPDHTPRRFDFIAKAVIAIQTLAKKVYSFLSKITRGYFISLVFLIAYFVYFIIAMNYEFGDEGSHRLLACTILGLLILLRGYIWAAGKWVIRKVYGADHVKMEHEEKVDKLRFFTRWIMYGVLIGVAVWLLIDEGRDKPKNMRALPGLFCLMLVPLLFSTHPSKIDWHLVFWSLGLQFLAAAFVLKWKPGRDSMLWTQDRVDEFFANSRPASVLIFGETWAEHGLIFGAFPTVFFFNSALTVLYYLGVMPFIIKTLGQFFKFVLGATRVECTTVAISIFVEGLYMLMSIKPLLGKLTKSELFLIVTAAYSSIGGSVLALLSQFGISLNHVLPAMLISAPATFAVCKMMMPEAKEKHEIDETDVALCEKEQTQYLNIMDAAQMGAVSVIKAVANIFVVAYAFWALVSWVNHTLSWFGDRVGVEKVTIEYISSYLLYPLALAMGVDTDDCRRVAMLLGTRLSQWSIAAFIKLYIMKLNKKAYLQYMQVTNFTGPVSKDRDDIILVGWNATLNDGFISDRSERIATYALCGMSSFLIMAMVSGILFALVPKRKAWLIRIAIPSVVAGNIANCMTGCFASIFGD